MNTFDKLEPMQEFDKWLFEEPWRLERYYDMVPGMTKEEKHALFLKYLEKYLDIFKYL